MTRFVICFLPDLLRDFARHRLDARKKPPVSRKPIRIAVLHFSHETVTFLKNDTTLADFIYQGSPAKGEALLAYDRKSYMGGFVKMAREYDEVELVGIESPLWPKTGTGSGWITEEAFETFVGKMISEIETEGKFDGVYLCLHGAMGVRGVARPEAELARRVRAVVGPGAFIVGTFDPHGNEDEAFLRHADMAFTVKYFPHYDSYLQGERAARMLVRAIRGDYAPSTVTLRVPIISPTVLQWTGASPWMDLVQRALTWEAREPDVYVNFFFGFPFADVPDVGMTFQVMTNGDAALARKVADDMASAAWRRREALIGSTTVHTIPQGVTLAKEAVARGATPVVLADHSDRSGSATWLLKEIIAQDLSDVLIATIADAKVSDALKAAGVKAGDPFDMEVGGLADESAGAPVRIQGTVLNAVEGYGQLWVVVQFGRGNVLVISRYLVQVMEPLPLNALGFDVTNFKVIAIKSRVHFRRGFDDSGFAKTILLVEPIEPFLGTVRLDGLPYQNVDLKKFYPYGEPKFP
jgi:microcystin degradation protein MlrC